MFIPLYLFEFEKFLSSDVDEIAKEIARKEPLVTDSRIEQVKQLIYSKPHGIFLLL